MRIVETWLATRCVHKERKKGNIQNWASVIQDRWTRWSHKRGVRNYWLGHRLRCDTEGLAHLSLLFGCFRIYVVIFVNTSWFASKFLHYFWFPDDAHISSQSIQSFFMALRMTQSEEQIGTMVKSGKLKKVEGKWLSTNLHDVLQMPEPPLQPELEVKANVAWETTA